MALWLGRWPTAGLVESNGSLRRVHDCHLLTDCLESWMSSEPYTHQVKYGTTFTFFNTGLNGSVVADTLNANSNWYSISQVLPANVSTTSQYCLCWQTLSCCWSTWRQQTMLGQRLSVANRSVITPTLFQHQAAVHLMSCVYGMNLIVLTVCRPLLVILQHQPHSISTTNLTHIHLVQVSSVQGYQYIYILHILQKSAYCIFFFYKFWHFENHIFLCIRKYAKICIFNQSINQFIFHIYVTGFHICDRIF